MTMLASKLGIRLILLLGKNVPQPAPAEVMTTLQKVKVVNDVEREDGFELTFALTKSRRGEFNLLTGGAVAPDTREVIGVFVGVKLFPLIDGVIYHQQLNPGQSPGTAQLTVMGRSIIALLDLEQRTDTYPNQKSSDIVKKIISSRGASYGIVGLNDITTTQEQPSDQKLIPSQNKTDRAYIQDLASRNGFIFYLEPATLGTTNVYWGPKDRKTTPLPDLYVDCGSATNVTELRFAHDPKAPIKVEGDTIEPGTKKSQKIQPPAQPITLSVARPTQARRIVRLRCGAKLGPAAARDAASAMQTGAPYPVTTEGVLDTVRYGHVLRAHRVVKVHGAGRSYDGDYLVQRVTHEIEVGKYTQSFTLTRQGLEAAQ